MSDQIPFHVQEEIMKRLPGKSLVQFRSVSKAWRSLIDSPEFIAAHSLLSHTQPQHLLVSYEDPEEEIEEYVCFVDDETLFQQRPVTNSPPYVKESLLTNIVGISHGLVCFYSPGDELALIWNPSIRKLIVVDVPGEPFVGQIFVGFGVCPVTTDPKIVAIRQSWDDSNMETLYHWEVMVYTLSSGIWTSLSTNLPPKPIHRWGLAITADGFTYWHGGTLGHNKIISFDVTNESFKMIDLPDSLASHDPVFFHIYNLRGSLAIIQYDSSTSTHTVWKMEGGVQRSFTKLFSINASVLSSLVGFRKSWVPILRVVNDALVVYEPNSEHNNVLQVSGNPRYVTVDSYMETLLLLAVIDITVC